MGSVTSITIGNTIIETPSPSALIVHAPDDLTRQLYTTQLTLSPNGHIAVSCSNIIQPLAGDRSALPSAPAISTGSLDNKELAAAVRAAIQNIRGGISLDDRRDGNARGARQLQAQEVSQVINHVLNTGVTLTHPPARVDSQCKAGRKF